MAFGWGATIDYSYPLVVACDSIGVRVFASSSSNSNSCSCSGCYCQISLLAMAFVGSAAGNSDGDGDSGSDSDGGAGFRSHSNAVIGEAGSVVNRTICFDFSSRVSYDAAHHRYLCSVRLKRRYHRLSFASSRPLQTFHRSYCRKLPLQRHR